MHKCKIYSSAVAMLVFFVYIIAMPLLFSLNFAAALETDDGGIEVLDQDAPDIEGLNEVDPENEADDIENETDDLLDKEDQEELDKEDQEEIEVEDNEISEREGLEPPMVYNHIFSPDPDMEGMGGALDDEKKMPGGLLKEDDQFLDRVKKDIVLTGIIITPAYKKALIQFRGAPKLSRTSEFFESGAVFEDYVLKDIFPNYIVVSCKDKEVKLGLYRERGDRPSPLKDENTSSQTGKTGSNKQLRKTGGNEPGDEQDEVEETQEEGVQLQEESDNPLANVLQKKRVRTATPNPAPQKIQIGNGAESTENPFLKAIQRARERQEQGE